MRSKMRAVGSDENALIEPLVAATIAALDTMLASYELRVDTTVRGAPSGHKVKNPKKPEGTTVAFSE